MQSTGTQYITINPLLQTSNLPYTLYTKYTTSAANYTRVFGYYSASTAFEYIPAHLSLSHPTIKYGSTTDTLFAISNPSSTDVCELNCNINSSNTLSATVNNLTTGASSSVTVTASALPEISSIAVFATIVNGTVNNKFIGKIYSFYIMANGTKIKNLVPAQRNSDGVLGMHDTIADIFYTNSGTGVFIGG